jgi:hypothetical protein
MVEAYLDIYPDIEEEPVRQGIAILFSTATVRPRSEKYVPDLTVDGKSHHRSSSIQRKFDSVKVKNKKPSVTRTPAPSESRQTGSEQETEIPL